MVLPHQRQLWPITLPPQAQRTSKINSKSFMGFTEAEFQALRNLLQNSSSNSRVDAAPQMHQFTTSFMNK
ncbi:hypothetical protein A2U01_0071770 [Trifolium medium]|uniref:Uncharacterized protein n=1 Tax=Trifolium medium TaxID=97028 RepID=A0A392SRP2_9FABA|nr:hypothetical protein [Trifolium medium]